MGELDLNSSNGGCVNDIELAQRGEVHLQRVRLQRGDRAGSGRWIYNLNTQQKTPRVKERCARLGSGVAPPLGVVDKEVVVLIVLVRRHRRANIGF